MADKTPPTPDQNFIDELNKEEQAKKRQQNTDAQIGAINKAGIKNVEATNRTTDAVNKGTKDIRGKVEVTNPDLAKTDDIASTTDAIHKLNLTTFNTNKGLPQLADNLVNLTKVVNALQKDYENKGVSGLSKQLTALLGKLDNISKTVSSSKVEIDTGLQKTIDGLKQSIDSIELKPNINVKTPTAKVVTTPVDFKPVLKALSAVEDAVKSSEVAEPVDLSPIISGLSAVQDAITNQKFPVANYILPFKDSNGKATQVQLDGSGNVPVANGLNLFRDGFATPFNTPGVPDPAVWTLSNTDGHLCTQGGNSSGSSYFAIHLNPLLDDSEVTLTSVATFPVPFRFGVGVSISQRIVGQETFVGTNGDDGNGNIDFSTTPIADQAITGNIVIASNVGTVTLANHPYTGGDRVSIYGAADSRMNAGPLVVTVVDQNSFTVPITAPNATYSGSGAYVRYADPLRYAYNGGGYLFENATATNGSTVSRRNGQRFRSLNSTVSTTAATQTNTSPFTDAFNSAGNFEHELRLEEINYRSFASDGVATANVSKYTQGIPDNDPAYHLHFRARNLKGLTKPIARITAIAKTGTTTATVTTDTPHGLTTSDFVQIYGVNDQTNYPNLTVATAVASVIDSTHFTVVIGSATTTNSVGGTVWRVQGGVLAPGVFTSAVQSIACASNIMTVTGSATWATPLPGEYVYLYGMQNGAGTYDGAYKVLKVSTTTLTLAAPGVADFGTISNTGGAGMRMTSVRFHFARLLDYTRLIAEIVGGRGNTTDINNAVPSALVGGTVTTVSTLSSMTNGNLGFPGSIADLASAALTTTTTTAAVAPTYGTAYKFNIPVTAVSGTNPTLDLEIQESRDTGTNYQTIYQFPQITATGSYDSPTFTALGNRYRIVQTVGGTTPSFTRAINRTQLSSPGTFMRQIVDNVARSTINLNSTNSTSAALRTEQNTNNVQLTVDLGTVVVAPVLQIQASDDLAATWYNVGATLTAVASSTVSLTVNNVTAQFFRVLVQTGGTTANKNYVLLRAF